MQGVSVQQLAEKMKFKCFTPCVDMHTRDRHDHSP